MSSVKISELNALTQITSDDFIAIVDSGSGTTYRASFNTLNGWMAAFGFCLTASYASSSLSSSYARSASYALSSSYALSAKSSSYALTASYYNLAGINADTATTASYSLTSSCLQGRGTSWDQTIQVSRSLILAKSASLTIGRKRFLEDANEPLAQNAIFFNNTYGTGDPATNDFCLAYYTEQTTDWGRLTFQMGDNVDYLLPSGPDIELALRSSGGFLWGTVNTDGPFSTGSLLFISIHGKVSGRSFEARDFSASFAPTTVGFYGTASWAQNVVGGVGVVSVPIGTIVDYAGATAPVDANWALCDGSELSQVTYAALYAVLGTTWGVASNPGTLFKLPDLRQRVTVAPTTGMSSPSTYISGTVGSTGGSDGICHHYHVTAQPKQGIYPDGSTRNDDLQMFWINDQNLNITSNFPHYYFTSTNTFNSFYSITGDNSGDPGIYQPHGAYSTSGETVSGFIVGTSYGLVSGSKTNPGVPALPYKSTSGDLMIPYGVCNKIIRIQ